MLSQDMALEMAKPFIAYINKNNGYCIMGGILSKHHKITLLGIQRHVKKMYRVFQKKCAVGVLVTKETIFIQFLQLAIAFF